jgi:putative ABC transport system permease protein
MRISTLALANLRRRRGRAAFLTAGIALGIGTVVALLGLNAALREEIGSQMDQFGANIVVTPHAGNLALNYGGVAVTGVSFDEHRLSNEDIGRIRQIPYRKRLSAVAPKLLGSLDVDGRNTIVAGVDFANELRLKRWWRITGGQPKSPKEILVGYDVARAASAIEIGARTAGGGGAESHHPTAEVTVRLTKDTLHVAGEQYRIAGVVGQTGGPEDRMVFAALGEVQSLLGKPNELSVIEVSALCKDCPVEDIVGQIRKVLPHSNVSAIQQAVRARTEAVERLSRFSLVVGLVVLALGALMIFTTMMNSVVERTREIGVLRAIGFRRGHIIKGLLIEVAVISAAGGILGWGGGVAAGQLALPYFAEGSAQLETRAPFALGAIAVSLLTGLISSVYPALRASRLDPSEAVRSF